MGLGVDRQVVGRSDHRHAAAAEHAGKSQFAHSFREWHDGSHGHRGRTAHKDVQAKLFLLPDRGRVVGSDPAVDLIMDPHLVVRLVQAPGHLDSVHPQISNSPNRVGRDPPCKPGETAMYAPPSAGHDREVRQLIDRGFVGEHRPATDQFGPRAPGQPRRLEVEAGAASMSAGSTASLTNRSKDLSESRKMKRTRAIVPKRLLTMGNRQPWTLA